MRISTWAGFELLVGEPGALGAEHHRGRRAPRFRHDARGGVAHVQHAEVLVALARSGRRHEAAATPAPRASVATTRAAPSTSSAPEARAVASACGNCRGRTSTSSSSAMFFIARATAPMLPGCEGATRTMRMEGEFICYATTVYGQAAAGNYADDGLIRA